MFRVSSPLKKFRYNSDVDVNVKSCVSDPIMILATLTSHSSFCHNIKNCDELRVRDLLQKTFTLIKTFHVFNGKSLKSYPDILAREIDIDNWLRLTH